MKDLLRSMKEASPVLAATDCELRNNALKQIAISLKANSEAIFAANRVDLDNADSNSLPESVKKRLRFNEDKLRSVLEGIESLIGLPDPLGKIQLHRELDEGLELTRISCPIGVIGVIFEARPDALVQISTLCLKSGNCAILKGGSETVNTNRELFKTIYHAAVKAGLPKYSLAQAEERSQIRELLECDEYVDLLIPRGSNSFVRYIMDNTRIPVMGHADGVCHMYIDKSADPDMAIKCLIDAKTQYVSVCNAIEMALIDSRIADTFMPRFFDALQKAHVKLRGDDTLLPYLDDNTKEQLDFELITSADYHTEYLDYILSAKVVKGVDEAIKHINRYGSHHTDSIIADDDKAAETFFSLVDSANVYRNCSTRFADGFRYGFGAEVGISTGKLHARGPVGLEGLVTYKYLMTGQGHIVADYASGNKHFRFRDL